MKRTIFIGASFAIALALFFVSGRMLGFFLPDGIQSKGESHELTGYLSLATAIASLISGIVGLLRAHFELKKARAQGAPK